MIKYVLFFLIPLHIKYVYANINDGQTVNLILFNDTEYANMIDYETIIVPVRCNCFTTKRTV